MLSISVHAVCVILDKSIMLTHGIFKAVDGIKFWVFGLNDYRDDKLNF